MPSATKWITFPQLLLLILSTLIFGVIITAANPSLAVSGLKTLYVNDTYHLFEFNITHRYNHTQTINWTLVTDDLTFHSQQGSQTNNGSIWVFFAYNYSLIETYNVTARATNGTEQQQDSILLYPPTIAVTNLSTLNVSGSRAIVEFRMNTTHRLPLTGLNWTLNTNTTLLHSLSLGTLTNQTIAFVFVEYNFSNPGIYLVNVSALNGTSAIDTKSTTITIN